jgi:hypothetical protein
MKPHIAEKITSLQKHLEKVQQMTAKSSDHGAWIEREIKRTKRTIELLRG